VGEPERQELRVEAKALGLRIGDGREVLETRKGGCAPVDHQLAGIRGADTHHEHDVDVHVLLEQLGALVFGNARERDDIGPSEHLAKVAEWQALDVRHVADLLLRAAWCCVDEGDTEAERYFRRKAAWKFEEALASYDGVAREERAVLTYLVGELWRRVGDDRQAAAWFNRVGPELSDPATQQWVLDAARQQRDCPREWFG
jgi:hypothetical protein